MLLDLLSIFRQVATEDLHSRYQYELLGKAIPLPYCARKEGLFVTVVTRKWKPVPYRPASYRNFQAGPATRI